MKGNLRIKALAILGLMLLASCGNNSSSGSQSTPSGLTSEQRDRYNNLSPEGKEYVRKQMDAYDKSTKR